MEFLLEVGEGVCDGNKFRLYFVKKIRRCGPGQVVETYVDDPVETQVNGLKRPESVGVFRAKIVAKRRYKVKVRRGSRLSGAQNSMYVRTIRTIEKPTNAFTMECVATGACVQFVFLFIFIGRRSKYLESIKAGANYQMYGSTFTIDNTARGQGLTVRSIECGGGLCAGATFRFLNSDYGDIKCEEYVGCGAYEQFLFFLICAGGMAKYLERIKARTNYR